jgi:hypothetical protein
MGQIRVAEPFYLNSEDLIMKNLLKVACASALMCLCLAMPSSAQIANSLSFTTTFAFYAGNTKLPAGSYKVTPTNYGSSTLQIENSTGTHTAFIEFVATQAENGHAAGDVVFKKYGNVDFLSRLWVAGQTYGMMLEPTKVEQKLAESGAPQTHSVAAK